VSTSERRPIVARESYADRARRGAALLDRLYPSWFKKIDLDKLALTSCTDCVCGQLARKSGIRAMREERSIVGEDGVSWTTFTQWMAKKLTRRTSDEVWFTESFEHGFIAHSDYGYRVLDKEWGRIVRERLETAS
jgi:hypothetical protein